MRTHISLCMWCEICVSLWDSTSFHLKRHLSLVQSSLFWFESKIFPNKGLSPIFSIRNLQWKQVFDWEGILQTTRFWNGRICKVNRSGEEKSRFRPKAQFTWIVLMAVSFSERNAPVCFQGDDTNNKLWDCKQKRACTKRVTAWGNVTMS